MEMLKDPSEVYTKLHELGLSSWAALHNLSRSDRVTVFGPYKLSLEHYPAACYYKNLMQWDWGHKSYASATVDKPVCTNIIVGKSTNDATMSINQLTVSLLQRRTGRQQLLRLERLGHALLGYAQAATDEGGVREVELV